ncbi:hypothetical protein pb186bvf_006317 [Paramecium bursaria]
MIQWILSQIQNMKTKFMPRFKENIEKIQSEKRYHQYENNDKYHINDIEQNLLAQQEKLIFLKFILKLY